ncbi:MAG: efflux RND transporter periplasmic adaptor subunit [Maricaulaceae bacterium]
MRRVLFVVGALVVAGGVAAWVALPKTSADASGFDIETTSVERTDVRSTVATSGAVRALVTVEVGSQLSGQISELFADFNDEVKAGGLLARLDPQTFETRVRESEAALSVADATIAVQRAGLERAEAVLENAQADYARSTSLMSRGATSQAALDAAKAALKTAEADLAVAQANLVNAQATRVQRLAALESARIDLERTFIRSPIDGVVVERAIDLGQTVAASLNAPILFTIAQDLTEVQIDAQVDEADIGQVSAGQTANFTVDAFPNVDFEGEVEQIRLAALNEGNVVTYTVVVSARNPDRRLLPGMTANLDIITGSKDDALVVSNQAVRFEPRGPAEALVVEPPQGGRGPQGGGRGGQGGGFQQAFAELGLSADQQAEVRSQMQSVFAGLRAGGGAGGPPDRDLIRARIEAALAKVLTPEQMEKYRALQAQNADRRTGVIYVLNGDKQLTPRRVVFGLTDDRNTEILQGQLEEGDAIVTRVRAVNG